MIYDRIYMKNHKAEEKHCTLKLKRSFTHGQHPMKDHFLFPMYYARP